VRSKLSIVIHLSRPEPDCSRDRHSWHISLYAGVHNTVLKTGDRSRTPSILDVARYGWYFPTHVFCSDLLELAVGPAGRDGHTDPTRISILGRCIHVAYFKRLERSDRL
jgi:hypothetical protein